MPPVIIALPDRDESRKVKCILNSGGFTEVFEAHCGAQALAIADGLEPGLIISGYRLTDMTFETLTGLMPGQFKSLLLAPSYYIFEKAAEDIVSLSEPYSAHDLLSTAELMLGAATYERKKRKGLPKGRSPEEKAIVDEAKALLMNRNNMTEKEAHRYIQKRCMNESTSFVEMAQTILKERI